MARLRWSYKDDDEKDDILEQPTSIRSVQSSWQPTKEFSQPQDQNYFLTDEYAQQENDRRQAEAQRQAQVEAENARIAQANAYNQAQRAQEEQSQAQSISGEDRKKQMQEYAQGNFNNQRDQWERNRSGLEKILGMNKFDDNKAWANAQSSAYNSFANWDNPEETAQAQKLARSSMNIANATPRVDTSLGGTIGSALGSRIGEGVAPMINSIRNLGTKKASVFNDINQKLYRGEITHEEANDYLRRNGLDRDLDNNFIFDEETGYYRKATPQEQISSFARQITAPPLSIGEGVAQFGQVAGETVFGKDKDPENFNFDDPTEYLRFVTSLVPGMTQGILEAPDKFMSGSQRLAAGDIVGGAAELGDAAITVFGLPLGGSGTLLKGVLTKEFAKRGVMKTITKLAKDMGSEAGEEFLQSILSQISENSGLDNFSIEDAVQDGMLGLIGGGVMSGSGMASSAVRSRVGFNQNINQNLERTLNRALGQDTNVNVNVNQNQEENIRRQDPDFNAGDVVINLPSPNPLATDFNTPTPEFQTPEVITDPNLVDNIRDGQNIGEEAAIPAEITQAPDLSREMDTPIQNDLEPAMQPETAPIPQETANNATPEVQANHELENAIAQGEMTPEQVAEIKQRQEQMKPSIRQRLTDAFNGPEKFMDGFIAGPLALDFSKAKKDGLVFDGVDGKPRFEVDDSGAKIIDDYFDERQLQDVLDHQDLFKNYPELKNLKIVEQPAFKGTNSKAAYDRKANAIAINPDLMKKPEELRSTILHEVQHAIQNKEGFARGGGHESVGFNHVTDDEYRSLTEQIRLIRPEANKVSKQINDAFMRNDIEAVRKLSDSPVLKKQSELVRKQNVIDIARHNPQHGYERLAGEAEARAVQARMDMPMSERYVPDTDNSFRDGHAAPSKDTTPTAQKVEDGGDFSLTEVAQGFHNQPSDYFDERVGARYYGYDNQIGRESATAIGNVVRALKAGKKDVTVTAYRAVPKDIESSSLQNNDWVTFSKSYARQHGEHRFGEGEYKIVEQDVKPDDLHWDGNDINEWGYDNGKESLRSTFYDSLDVPKEDLIVRNDGGKAMSVEPEAPQVGKTATQAETKTPEIEVPTKLTEAKVETETETNTNTNTPPKNDFLEGLDENAPVDDNKTALERAISIVDTKGNRAALNKIAKAEPGAGDVDVAEVLDTVKGTKALKDGIVDSFNKIEKVAKKMNKIQGASRKSIRRGVEAGDIEAGVDAIDSGTTKERSRLQREFGLLEKRLNKQLSKLEGQNSASTAIANAIRELVTFRKQNILTSMPSVDRNVTQELTAGIGFMAANPIKFFRGVKNTHLLGEFKKGVEGWKNTPQTVAEAPGYVMGNTLNNLYTVTSALTEQRKDVIRAEVATTVLKMSGIPNPTRAQVNKTAGALGNDSEVIVNMVAGVQNGMTNAFQAEKAWKAYAEFIKTGSSKAHADFIKNAETQQNLVSSLTSMWGKSNSTAGRLASSALNLVFPIVNTPMNLVKSGFYNLNPTKMNILDTIGAEVRSRPGNFGKILKNQAIKIGFASAVVGLIEAGVIGYNDKEEIDKPRGLYIELGNDHFIPIRATAFEVPVAAIYVAHRLINDVNEGKEKTAGEYAQILWDSVPYVSEVSDVREIIDEALGREVAPKDKDGKSPNNYKWRNYYVNMVSSFIPGINNGFYNWVHGVQGKSVNQKTTYDKNDRTWIANRFKLAFNIDRESLKDSVDPSGQIRTVDSQGTFVTKTINDAKTKQYNEAIENNFGYVEYNGYFKTREEAYDTWGDSKLKSVRDSVVFVDDDPSKASFLKNNEDLYQLSQQIKDGIFGDKGSDLLTLKGSNLYSMASTNTTGGDKNSTYPISMLAINNAIAQTGMSEADRNRLRELSQANSELFERSKAKEITYEQSRALQAQNNAEVKQLVQSSENGRKLMAFYNHLNDSGFFEKDGYGSTKSGQIMLWNTLNAMLGEKGKTPFANWDTTTGGKQWSRGGRKGSGLGATFKPSGHGIEGIKSNVKSRSMGGVKLRTGKFTPYAPKVKLKNQVKKDRSKLYDSRTI